MAEVNHLLYPDPFEILTGDVLGVVLPDKALVLGLASEGLAHVLPSHWVHGGPTEKVITSIHSISLKTTCTTSTVRGSLAPLGDDGDGCLPLFLSLPPWKFSGSLTENNAAPDFLSTAITAPVL